MAAAASGSACDVVLRDGATVHLRPVERADAPALTAFFEGLSRDSLYLRFFTIPHSPRAEVARLIEADGVMAMAMVAESGGAISGVATWRRDERRPKHAEVAFVVADRLQGRGLGTRMLEVLADEARDRGFDAFDAYVLTSNHHMMRVFLDSGFEVDTRLDSGVVRVVFRLARTAAFEDRAAERSETAAGASLRAVLSPASVAVIGANRTRGRIGAEVLHNLKAGGFTGRLVAVHPSATSIDGVPAFASIVDVPGDIDLAVVCVPARQVLDVVQGCLIKGVRALTVISAGFAESGSAGRALEEALVAQVRSAGIRLVGPNCLGVINTDPRVRLNATFAPTAPLPGRVAMSTQSGALGLAIIDYARQLNIGLSTFVSVGNKADVSGNDLLQFWGADPNTDVILLYLESFGNPRKFAQIARRVSRRKPIVAVKAGRSAAGVRAAASHTGALASRDTIVDALFHQAGVIRTSTIEELFDVTAVLAHQPLPRGRGIGILTNAGGPGILAADACEAQGLELRPLSDVTVAALRNFLPPAASVSNPVDMLASAPAEHYEQALDAMLADPAVHAAIVIFIPPLVTEAADVAAAVRLVSERHPEKPVAAIFMSSQGAPAELGTIPCFRFPESAATALAHAARRAEWLAAPEGAVPEFDNIDRATARAVISGALARGGGWLSPAEAQQLIEAAGIRMAHAATAGSEEEARRFAELIGYPVALKAIGPEILHKADIGGGVLDVKTPEALMIAWRSMSRRLGARMTGGLIQEMTASGVEILIGAFDDPTFGLVVTCAMGGGLTELIGDASFRLHPIRDLDAAAMVDGLDGARVLRGYRGRPPADEAALRTSLLRLSALIELCPEISELDINPLMVFDQGVKAVDVRILVQPPRSRPATRRIAY